LEIESMNRLYAASLALALATLPLALAHSPAGTPKNFCESTWDWGEHDYGPPATGYYVRRGIDEYWRPVGPSGAPGPSLGVASGDGNLVGDCDGDGVPGDYDLHGDWAIGGAVLQVATTACSSEWGHHSMFGPISVSDVVLGYTVPFFVGVDTVGLLPGSCGDHVVDFGVSCIGTCTVTFPPGLDGTYVVFVGDVAFGVPGTYGHVYG
jgi:hypothetical protein